MNKTASKFLANIKFAEETYLDGVESILLKFRNDKERIDSMANKFIPEEKKKYLDQCVPEILQTARHKLGLAEQAFRSELKRNIAGMKEELQGAINAPIPPAFTERLSFYRAANLTPSKTETEALISMAGKNPLAVRAVAQLLDDTNAPFKIESRAIEAFEKDLQDLDDLAEMPLVHSPASVHHELCEVMQGQRKATRTAAGWREIGYTWDGSVDLLLHGTAVTSRLKALESVSDAWSADVTYSLREREHVAAEKKAKQEAEDNGEKYQPEPEPSSSVHIENRDSAVQLAREIGAETAAGKAAAAIKVCEFCGTGFLPHHSEQRFCSRSCAASFRNLGKYHEQKMMEQEAGAVTWRQRRERGEQRGVCLLCMKMFWTSEPRQFCSPACQSFWEATKNAR